MNQHIDTYVRVSDGWETAEYHVWMREDRLDMLETEIRSRMIRLGYNPDDLDVEVSPGGEYDLIQRPGQHTVSLAREIIELSGFCKQDGMT